MNVRSRLPLVPVALAAAVVLAGCGQRGEDTSAAPLSAAPTSAAPTSAAPTSAAPTSAAPTSAAPTSAAPAASLAAEAAGPARPATGATRVTFALLRPNAPDGRSLVATYDKVDYRRASCEAASARGVTDEQALYEACWSNVNPRLRTALFLNEDQGITAYYPSNNEPTNYEGEVDYAADELAILLLEPSSGHRSNEIAVWRIVERGGKIVELIEQPGGRLSAAEAAEAARA